MNASLTCVALVKVPLTVEPSNVSFGRIPRGSEAKKQTIKIAQGDAGPLNLVLKPVTHPNVKAELREIEPHAKYELDVEISPPWPKDGVRSQLMLETGIKESPTEMIRVYAQLAPRLNAVPSLLRIPTTVTAETDSRVQLIWSGDNPGHITEVTSSDPNTKVRVEDRKGRPEIVLTVPAGYTVPEGPRPIVTIKTDDEEAPELKIPVYVPAAPLNVRRPTPPDPTEQAEQSMPLPIPTTQPAGLTGQRGASRPPGPGRIVTGARAPTTQPTSQPRPRVGSSSRSEE